MFFHAAGIFCLPGSAHQSLMGYMLLFYFTLKFTIAVVNGYLSFSITQPVAVVKAANQAIIIVIPIIFYLYQALYL
jgi:hypothetical protein